jgi:hypothetical protein
MKKVTESPALIAMDKSLREQLVGAWRLVSCVETDANTGEVYLPMGEVPEGLILYTPDGYMSAQLSAADRKAFDNDDMYKGVFDLKAPLIALALQRWHKA